MSGMLERPASQLRNALTRQVFWRVLGLGFALMLGSTLLNGWLSYRAARARHEQELAALLEMSRSALSRAVWDLDERAVQHELQSLQSFPDLLSAEVRGPGIEAAYTRPGARPVTQVREQIITLKAPAGPEETARWTLRWDPDASLAQVWSDLSEHLPVVAIELMLQALLVYGLLAREVSAPIASLSRHLRGLRTDTLTTPAPEPTSRHTNELHELARGITRLQTDLHAELEVSDRRAQALSGQQVLLNELNERLTAHLDEVLEAMADGACVVSGEGQIERANPAFRQLLGLADERALEDVAWLVSPSWERLQQQLRGQPTLKQAELTVRRIDGSAVLTEASLAVMAYDQRHDPREPLAVQLVLRDVSARRAAEERLRAASAAAIEATRAKSQFLANISHEIRTPMNAILGMTDLALRTELSPQQLDYLSKARMAAQSLLAIVNDVLDFSKIEAGRLELEQVEFDLDTLLDELWAIVAVLAQQKRLRFVVDCPLGVPRSLKGDPLRLSQVLVNLCSNAIKFTEHGEASLRVALCSQSADDCVLQFVVTDTGVGMSDEQQARLFAPFSQGDASTTRRHGGTGLGLAISQQIVRLMGGEIRVESRPGAGSSFGFALRLARDPAQREPVLLAQLSLQDALVIVSQADLAWSFEGRLLASLRGSVRQTTSMQACRERLVGDATRPPPRLILVDESCLGRASTDALAPLRSLQLDPMPSLVLLSSQTSADAAQQATRAGFATHLVKPVRYALLRRLLARNVDPDARSLSQPPTGLPKSAPPCPPQLAGARVLLVDDNALNRQVACEFLRSVSVEVEVAGDGLEALECLRHDHFDLVLMDIQMPNMDGYEAAAAIRNEARWNALPVIAMTAHAGSRERLACLDAGMNDTLCKPFAPRELFAVVEKWVKREPLQRAEG